MSEQVLAQSESPGDAMPYAMPKPGLRAPAERSHRIPKVRGRAQEVAAMTTWRRWQDWVVVGLGVILFLTPFVFGEATGTVAASTAYVLGALIGLSGVLNAAMHEAGGLELVPAVLAVILLLSPWAFGFTAVTALASSAWIIAILVALTVGSLFAMRSRRAIRAS